MFAVEADLEVIRSADERLQGDEETQSDRAERVSDVFKNEMNVSVGMLGEEVGLMGRFCRDPPSVSVTKQTSDAALSPCCVIGFVPRV